MRIDLDDGVLKIELPKEVTDLYVNGALQGRNLLGQAEGPEDFTEQLKQLAATRNSVLMMRRLFLDARNNKIDSHYLNGLVEGLLGQYAVVAETITSPEYARAPAAVRSHHLGWDLGWSVYVALELAHGKPDPRIIT